MSLTTHRTPFLASSFALAALLAGCGGDPSASTDEPTSLGEAVAANLGDHGDDGPGIELRGRGSFSCDFGLSSALPLPAVPPAIERDRMYMSARPGMITKHLPMRDELDGYTADLVVGDPLQHLPRALPPGVKVVMVTHEVGRSAYRRSDAYHLFYRPHDVEHVVCAWMIGDRRYGEPGMTGLLLSRAPGQEPFSHREAGALEQALPALAAAARRSARVEATAGRCAALETMTDASAPPLAALAPTGRVLWMSPAAAALLEPPGELPAALIEAARRLGALARGQKPAPPPAFAGTFALPSGVTLRAELALARPPEGGVVVTVALASGPTARDRALAGLAGEHALTRTETEVLGILSRGLSNREIAAQLCVSVETVRTHVARILRKLSVETRTQAALAVREPRPMPHRTGNG